MRGMAAQIHEIATTYLLDPFLLIMPGVLLLAIVTGLAGRTAIFVEDLRHRHTVSTKV